MSNKYLVISDLQAPYHHTKALAFLKYLKKHFKIEDGFCYCVGDEVDFNNLSSFAKDPNRYHTAVTELEEAIEFFKEMAIVFPQLRVCYSNHQIRPYKRAIEAEIPEVFLKSYKEVIQAPRQWHWSEQWHVRDKHPFIVEHGDAIKGGEVPHKKAVEGNMVSTVHGHTHKAGITYIKNKYRGYLWGMDVGCLIDCDAIAFRYNQKQKKRPTLGAGVIVDGGKTPIFIPME